MTEPANVTLNRKSVYYSHTGYQQRKEQIQSLKKGEEEKHDAKDSFIPTILVNTCKIFSKNLDEQNPTSKKVHKHGHKPDPEEESKIEAKNSEYIKRQLNQINTNWCCFGQKYSTINAYKNLIKKDFGTFTPFKIRVDCYLYHGCDILNMYSTSNEFGHKGENY